MVTVTIVCTDAYGRIQAVQLRGLREAISIHKKCITWYKVKRTNVFNNLWHWEASLSHMFKIHTHIHRALHKYAFVPLLVETGPGNILNVTPYIFISLSLAARGRRTQQEARDHRFMKERENMLLICSTFPPECEATKGWQMLEWMEASDAVEPHR